MSSQIRKYNTANPLKKMLLNAYLNRLNCLVAEHSPHHLLDLGCGNGEIIRYLKKHHPSYHFVGIDRDSQALQRARQINSTEEFHLLDVNHLEPLQERRFDLLLLLEVLEHLPEPEKTLREISRLNFQGIIISVPWEPLFRLAVLLGNFYSWEKLKSLGRNPHHLQHYSPDTLNKTVSRHFDVTKVIPQFPWIFLSAQPGQTGPRKKRKLSPGQKPLGPT